MLNIDSHKNIDTAIQKRPSQRKMIIFLKYHIRHCKNVCVGRYIMV